MNRNKKNRRFSNKPKTEQAERNNIEFEEEPVSTIKEPRVQCSICGEVIESIIQAIRENNGTYSHFDCVLKKIEQEHNVQEPDKVSYIGNGCFGICSRDEKGSFFIKEKIQYENNESLEEMKKFVEENRK